jgi:hypothetical protein
MLSDIALFDSLSEWQAKVSELNSAFGYPNDRAERYADSPMVTSGGKYALQVLPEAESYFQGVQLHNFDDLFPRQEGPL